MENRCRGCKKLWYYLTHPKSEGEIKIEHFSDWSCSHHDALIRQLWKKDKDPKQEGEDMEQELKIKKSPYSDSPMISYSNFDQWYIKLVNDPSVPNHPGRHHILNDWVDTDLLLKWKSRCFKSHGERCDNPMKIWRTRPAWLIDVDRKCLVAGGESDHRFVALSYTYGKGVPSKVTSATTLSNLQTPGSLDASSDIISISPMIQHAMYLTTVLGEHFLWADALCIPHHDSATTVRQLNSMGAIYANATITIIAIDTDSEQGLPGLEDISSRREITQRVVSFGRQQVVVRPVQQNFYPLSSSSDSPYQRRGWTYQEGVMSCRKLIFVQDEVSWECSRCYIREGVSATDTPPSNQSPSYGLDTIVAGLQDTYQLNFIFRDFNARELSYDADALPSISGMLSVLTRTFSDGFLYGLPERFFDGALGWKTYHLRPRPGPRRGPQGGPRRRKASSGPHGADRTELGPSGLPSWSWIGWQGRVGSVCDENARIYPVKDSVVEIFPVTKWFTANSSTAPASKRRQISSSWYTDREKYKDPSTPLPSGWTREKVDKDKKIIFPEGCGSFVFKHEATKTEYGRMNQYDWRTDEWYYPVPVADNWPALPLTPVQTEYLFCETYRTQLQAYQGDSEHYPDKMNLFNAGGLEVGSLEAMVGQEDFPYRVRDEETGSELPTGKRVELVAISRMKEYEYVDQYAGNYEVVMTETMVVLWVKWVDGVAYRRGCGEVKKEEWDKLPLERIELVLG